MGREELHRRGRHALPLRLIVVAAVLAAAAPAQSATRVAERYAPEQGPVLAAGGVAWVRDGGDGQLSLVTSPGGAQALPQTADRAYTLAASGRHVGVELLEHAVEGTGIPDRRTAYAGPIGQVLERRSGPCNELTFEGAGLALAGAWLAYGGPGCGDRSVLNLDNRASAPLPAEASDLRAEGDWVAWREGKPGRLAQPFRLVVRNLRTGAGYRIPRQDLAGAPYRFDVDAHGRIAASFITTHGGRARTHVVWAAPGSAAPRELRVPPGMQAGTLRISAGRIAMILGTAARPLTSGRLAIYDTSQGRDPAIRGSGLDTAVLPRDSMDFDGEQVAVEARRCGRVDLIIARPGARALNVPQPRRCRLRLNRRPRLDAGAGRLVIEPSCAGYTRTCLMQRIRARTIGGLLVASRRYGDPPARVRMRLTPLGVRLAAAGRLRRVRISAGMGDIGSQSTQRRHTTIARVEAEN